MGSWYTTNIIRGLERLRWFTCWVFEDSITERHHWTHLFPGEAFLDGKHQVVVQEIRINSIAEILVGL